VIGIVWLAVPYAMMMMMNAPNVILKLWRIKMDRLVWYHKLGFFNNPFSVKPVVFHDEVIGYDQTMREIIEKIMDSNIVFISGEYGTGKTTALKGIIKNLEVVVLKRKKLFIIIVIRVKNQLTLIIY